MRNSILIGAFVLLAAALGLYAQEESGACLPEHHQAEVEDKKFCNCVAMGGYQLCHGDKPFSYQEWREENERREADKDKNGKQKQPNVPMCSMACKEDHCECCSYMEKFKNRRKVALTYDPY